MEQINIVDQLSINLAETIKRNLPESSSLPVLRLGISTMINFLITFSIVTVITIITGNWLDGVFATIAFSSLRYFSGGLHIRSANVCNIVSSIIVLFSVYLSVVYWYNGLVINILTVVILLWNAPNGIKRSKLSSKYYPVLKAISVLIVSLNFIVHSPLLTMVFFVQAMTTLPGLSRILNRINW